MHFDEPLSRFLSNAREKSEEENSKLCLYDRKNLRGNSKSPMKSSIVVIGGGLEQALGNG